MIQTCMVRGAAAGLLAGLFTGLMALVLAEPSIDAAIALEEAASSGEAHAASSAHSHAFEAARTSVDRAAESQPHVSPHSHAFSRRTQKLGLVVGLTLYGLSLGGLFGLVAAWATGRLEGDAWTRALKLGAAAALALVLIPAIKYPPNPPAVGDPDTVGIRTLFFLGLCLSTMGVLIVARSCSHALLQHAWSPPGAQLLSALGALLVLAGVLTAFPANGGAGAFPADLLWSFRLWSVATQLLLLSTLAALYGLFESRAEHPVPSVSALRA